MEKPKCPKCKSAFEYDPEHDPKTDHGTVRAICRNCGQFFEFDPYQSNDDSEWNSVIQ